MGAHRVGRIRDPRRRWAFFCWSEGKGSLSGGTADTDEQMRAGHRAEAVSARLQPWRQKGESL